MSEFAREPTHRLGIIMTRDPDNIVDIIDVIGVGSICAQCIHFNSEATCDIDWSEHHWPYYECEPGIIAPNGVFCAIITDCQHFFIKGEIAILEAYTSIGLEI
jgi:hypothetical protein